MSARVADHRRRAPRRPQTEPRTRTALPVAVGPDRARWRGCSRRSRPRPQGKLRPCAGEAGAPLRCIQRFRASDLLMNNLAGESACVQRTYHDRLCLVWRIRAYEGSELRRGERQGPLGCRRTPRPAPIRPVLPSARRPPGAGTRSARRRRSWPSQAVSDGGRELSPFRPRAEQPAPRRLWAAASCLRRVRPLTAEGRTPRGTNFD